MSGKETGYTYAKLVTVRGDGRSSGNSNTDFKYSLGNTMQRVSRISIPSVQFRNNAYNVNGSGGGANNTYGWAAGFAPVYGTITPGQYSTSTLMAALQSQINTVLTGYGLGQSIALAQDSLTNLVTLTYTIGSGSSFTLLDIANGDTGIWELLGFSGLGSEANPDVPPVRTSSTLTATNFPSLGGLTEVYLQSNAIAPGNMIEKDGIQRNTLLAIPVTAAFGFLNTFECKVDSLCEISYLSPRMLQEVDFYLTDKHGNIVDLHGANLTINLKVWFNRY